MVDTGKAQEEAVERGSDASVKVFLQHSSVSTRVNLLKEMVRTRTSPVLWAKLLSCVASQSAELLGWCGYPKKLEPNTTSSAVPLTAPETLEPEDTPTSAVPVIVPETSETEDKVEVTNTPFLYTEGFLIIMASGACDATQEQVIRLMAIRRLLLQVEAVHAVS